MRELGKTFFASTFSKVQASRTRCVLSNTSLADGLCLENVKNDKTFRRRRVTGGASIPAGAEQSVKHSLADC